MNGDVATSLREGRSSSTRVESDSGASAGRCGPSGSLDILQVNTSDGRGGAERVALNLGRGYRARGHGSWLAVGRRRTKDECVLSIRSRSSTGPWRRAWWEIYEQSRGAGTLKRWARRVARGLAEPAGWFDRLRGVEDFHFPGCRRLMELSPRRPDIVQCHNLHGDYFDLRALPDLCRQTHVVLTLHDAWLTTGHCAHAIACDRWRTGCGQCPDLSIYPAVRRDATAGNWRRKRDILAECRLHVATPSRWLMRQIEQSMLAPAIVESRVIPNGVDLGVFRPADRSAMRRRLGLPAEASVLLFAAFGIRKNPWKDYETMRSAVARLAARSTGRPVLFVAVGESAPPERVGRAEIRFVPHLDEPAGIAAYYQAADLYIHAARVDTFPNAILEALACGTPVVATEVGGIPEQILTLDPESASHCKTPSAENATGVLTPAGDGEAMADAIGRLLQDDGLRARMGRAAAHDATARFGLDRQVERYLSWFEEIRSKPVLKERCGSRQTDPSGPLRMPDYGAVRARA